MVYKYLSAINGYVAVFFSFSHTKHIYTQNMNICRNNHIIVRWEYIFCQKLNTDDTFCTSWTNIVIDLETGCLVSVMPSQKFTHIGGYLLFCIRIARVTLSYSKHNLPCQLLLPVAVSSITAFSALKTTSKV